MTEITTAKASSEKANEDLIQIAINAEWASLDRDAYKHKAPSECMTLFARNVCLRFSEDERHIVKERLKEKIEAIPECDCDDCAEGASAFAKGQRDMKRNIINEILQED